MKNLHLPIPKKNNNDNELDIFINTNTLPLENNFFTALSNLEKLLEERASYFLELGKNLNDIDSLKMAQLDFLKIENLNKLNNNSIPETPQNAQKECQQILNSPPKLTKKVRFTNSYAKSDEDSVKNLESINKNITDLEEKLLNILKASIRKKMLLKLSTKSLAKLNFYSHLGHILTQGNNQYSNTIKICEEIEKKIDSKKIDLNIDQLENFYLNYEYILKEAIAASKKDDVNQKSYVEKVIILHQVKNSNLFSSIDKNQLSIQEIENDTPEYSLDEIQKDLLEVISSTNSASSSKN